MVIDLSKYNKDRRPEDNKDDDDEYRVGMGIEVVDTNLINTTEIEDVVNGKESGITKENDDDRAK